jgi:ABC-2 type transport system ATP-binding protein
VLPDLEEICTSLAILEKGKLLRHGKIADVMRSAGQTRRVRMRLAGAEFDLSGWLRSQPNVSDIQEGGEGVEFVFPGTDGDLAALLRAVVLAGAPLYSVEEKTDSLEKLFARLSTGEVM